MVLKFILLEACVGIASLIAFYLAIVLTWYSYHQSKRPTTSSVQSLLVHPTTKPSRKNGVVLSSGVPGYSGHAKANGINEAHRESEFTGNIAVTSNHAVALERLCIVSVWFVLVRCISEHVALLFAFVDLKVTTYCDVINKLHTCLYLLPFTLEYAFLWLQQRVVYFHPLLSRNRCSSVLSWLGFCMLIFGEIVTASLFMVNVRYDHVSIILTNITLENNVYFCVSSTQGMISHFAPWISMACSTLVFQCCFLILFIKPLILCGNTLRRLESGVCHYQTNPFHVLKRLLLVFGICFATDIVSFSGALAANDYAIAGLVLDFNLLINFICLLLTYDDWKKRVFPCKSNEITPSSSRSDTRCIASTTRTPVSSVSTNVEDVFDDH